MVKRIVASMLIAVILTFSVSVLALDIVDPETGEVITSPDQQFLDAINEWTVVQYIKGYLASIGIYVDDYQAAGMMDKFDAWLLQQIYDYLDSIPSIRGLAEWILPWSLGWDGWDNMVGNASFLEDMQDFVDWLVTKFSMGNNTVTVQAPAWLFGEFYGFVDTYSFTIINGNGTGVTYPDRRYVVGGKNNTEPVYGIFVHIGNSQRFGVLTKSLASYKFSAKFNNKNYSPSTVTIDFGSGGEYSATLGDNYYFYEFDTEPWSLANQIYVGLPIYDFDTLADAKLAFDISDPQQQNQIEIISGNIVLPDDDPDFTPGDGVIIIRDDDYPNYIYIYQEIEFPDTISVDNLPAVIMPNQVQNIPVEDAYSPLRAALEEFEESASLISTMVNDFDSSILLLVYAVIGMGILFAVIKVMRE